MPVNVTLTACWPSATMGSVEKLVGGWSLNFGARFEVFPLTAQKKKGRWGLTLDFFLKKKPVCDQEKEGCAQIKQQCPSV
jgi:hypothetical protein